MYFVITIDTEEDSWGEFKPQGHTVRNIKNLKYLQDLFDKYNIIPTYLVTYPIVENERSASFFQETLDSGRCEIGMHCHPWNTPPFKENTNEKNSMMRNLPSSLQFEKLKTLDKFIKTRLTTSPVSFRCGRWGYSTEVAKNLVKLNYKIDTSITPYISWNKYFGPDFNALSPELFLFDEKSSSNDQNQGHGSLLEVPTSIGYLQNNYELSNKIYTFLSAEPFNKLRLIGLLHKLNLLNKAWLCPENHDVSSMIKLAKVMISKNYQVLNMFFHSPTLTAGLTPFVHSKEDEKFFLIKIEEFLKFVKQSGITSIRLSDVLDLVSVNKTKNKIC